MPLFFCFEMLEKYFFQIVGLSSYEQNSSNSTFLSTPGVLFIKSEKKQIGSTTKIIKT